MKTSFNFFPGDHPLNTHWIMGEGSMHWCLQQSIPEGEEDPDNLPTIAAKLEPWLQSTLTGFGSGIRRPERERLIGWVNFVSCGVVSGKRLMFALETLTQLCHSYSKTFVGVIILPNRAGDLRSSPLKYLGYSTTCRWYVVLRFGFVIYK